MQFAYRVMDVSAGTGSGAGPITGVMARPLVDAEAAVRPLVPLFGKSTIATALWCAKQHAKQHLFKTAQAHGLPSVDQDDCGMTMAFIMAIHLYTQQAFYAALNKLLRDRDR